MSLQFVYPPFFLTPHPAPPTLTLGSVWSDYEAGSHPLSAFMVVTVGMIRPAEPKTHCNQISFVLQLLFSWNSLFFICFLFFPVAGISKLSAKSRVVNTVGVVGYL